MLRLLTIATAIFMTISCSLVDTYQTLNDVESYIMESPDSALVVLESIDINELYTPRNRAHHALLYAMALDKNYIDVTDDSLSSVAVDYYVKHGPKQNCARALYYRGKSYYYQQQYDKAILEYSKAERVAEKCDSLYLGMIKTAQARIYNITYNSIEELNCINSAFNIFTTCGAGDYVRPTAYSLAIAYHNTDQYDKATEIFKYLLETSTHEDYFYINSIIGMAHSMIEMSDVDYYDVDSLFCMAKYKYKADFEEKDYWAWAYSLYRLGNSIKANEVISSIIVTDEVIASFWRSRIAAYLKDYESVYEYDTFNFEHQNKIVQGLLEESLAFYQNDYYKSQLDLVEAQVQTKNMTLLAIIVLIILVSVIISISIIWFIKSQKVEKNKLLEYAEEIRRQLEEAKMNYYSELKRKFISLYKTRFETIGSLCDQYIQSAGRTDIEALMFKKVEVLINEVKNDSSNRIAFETMLDNDLDMIMTRIRTEMPKMKEVDYAIFSYLIVGFDATTISRLLDMTVNNVYARKHRIRVRIGEKRPEHAEQFLEMLT